MPHPFFGAKDVRYIEKKVDKYKLASPRKAFYLATFFSISNINTYLGDMGS